MSRTVRCCLLSAFATMALISSVADAQLLPERLVPPQQVPLPPLPATDQPAPRRPAGADRMPAHLWSLPFGVFPNLPTTLSHERLPADWRRAVFDAPQLASESDPTRPTFPRQPTAPAAFVASPDPTQLRALDRFPSSAEPAVRATDDPSLSPAYLLITLAVPIAVPTPAPLMRFAIPDPFEYLRGIQLGQPLADDDAPDAPQTRPPLPKLSTVGSTN